MIEVTLSDRPTLHGKLTYEEPEFVCENVDSEAEWREHGTAPLIIADTLSLEFDIQTGRFVYVWGYCPPTSWRHSAVTSFKAKSGAVCAKIASIEDKGYVVQRGAGIGLSPLDNAEANYDEHKGIIWFGEHKADEYIEINNGTTLGITDGHLVSIFLQPMHIRFDTESA